MHKTVTFAIVTAGAALGLVAFGATFAITATHAAAISSCARSAGGDHAEAEHCHAAHDDHKAKSDSDDPKNKERTGQSDGDRDMGPAPTPKPHLAPPPVEPTPLPESKLPNACGCHSEPVHITGPMSVTLPTPTRTDAEPSTLTSVPDTGVDVPWATGVAMVGMGGLAAGAARRCHRRRPVDNCAA